MTVPSKSSTTSTSTAGGMAQPNPADIAREAFRRLATRRIAPTPGAYREIYDEIAGLSAQAESTLAQGASAGGDHGAEQVLHQFAAWLGEAGAPLDDYGRRLTLALAERDWADYGAQLEQLAARAGVRADAAAAGVETAGQDDDERTTLLRDLLTRTLGMALPALLAGAPALAAEAEALATAIGAAGDESALEQAGLRLKQLCYQIELGSGDTAAQQELLLRLFKLLLENIGELLDDDSWLRGQIDVVQNLISGPLEQRALEEATRSLKEVIYKQAQLKHSMADVKLTVKNMMMTFIDRLGHVAASTGDYHEKIGGYSALISRAGNIGELNQILDEILSETRAVQAEALSARDKMVLARQEVQDAETRIHTLEAKLQHLSELVREDQLTGSLNRRGLDDVFERETARSDRRGTPLCIAMLDLDDFKRLNDTYGHLAGDAALKHLVKIVKDTLRPMDVIARFGGEEFLILLPETTVEAAAQTMTRLQRELTKHFFLHDNEKVLITFSAGVALRAPNEEQAELVRRADHAMYQAKQNGKNRVVVAD
jgi:diguanylate cyclase